MPDIVRLMQTHKELRELAKEVIKKRRELEEALIGKDLDSLMILDTNVGNAIAAMDRYMTSNPYDWKTEGPFG